VQSPRHFFVVVCSALRGRQKVDALVQGMLGGMSQPKTLRFLQNDPTSNCTAGDTAGCCGLLANLTVLGGTAADLQSSHIDFIFSWICR
jgi:hypothetical protein